ncbi:MAG: 3-keto-disaccharide hydrolase [Balneolaceae bacterium]
MACAQQHNTLSSQEENEGWELLFNGESAEHWRGYNQEDFPEEGWEVEDGVLTVAEPGQGGDIITRNKYENFEFEIEWKVERGGNSGIFYFVLEQPDQAIYWSGTEVQLLDDANHPDAQAGEDGNHQSGSLYDLIPAEPQNANPHGEWNTIRIVVEGAHVEHWMNGEKVVEYERWTPEWYEMLRNSKFECHPEFGDLREAHIGLQDHGGENDIVSFRNIKIKELD